MSDRNGSDNQSLINRLTQLGTGVTAVIVGTHQILNSMDVHPSTLLQDPRASTARRTAVFLGTSDAARMAGKWIGTIGAKAVMSKSTRRTGRKVAPLLLRRGSFVIGIGIGGLSFLIVGRMMLRMKHARYVDGIKRLNSGKRNAELARRSNEAVLDVDALMPRTQQENGTKISMPFPS